MNNFSHLLLVAVTLILLNSCSSTIDKSLLAQIEHRTELTEELFEQYEDINDDLIDLTEEKNYHYKKLIKNKAIEPPKY